MTMSNSTIETEDTFASLLELAANDDIEAFKIWIERDLASIHEVGLWYGRQKGSKQMVLDHRTPLMVAATYGSIDALKQILSLPEVDVNRSCGHDKSTALHCAASGGSLNAAEAVKLLLGAGADPHSKDINGHYPIDVIVVSPNFHPVKSCLESLLMTSTIGDCKLRVSVSTSSSSPPRSPSPGNRSPYSASDSTFSPKSAKSSDLPSYSIPEKKEYPVDPSLPDIKNDIYSSDEFRMFSFKIRPCSRAYSHDWTECPFLHPGENARRRDPRKYHYSCVPCPEFRKGACQRGDMCEYAHGVFECWLHPAQYRTRLCKDGIDCNRRVCFFAHKQDDLRPLYVSTGSAVPSPCGNSAAVNAMDFAAAMGLIPGSPSSVSVMSPSPFTPPVSPSANGISSMGWAQRNAPPLHLPGSFVHSSRLWSSLSARGIPAADLSTCPDFDVQRQQFLNEFSCLSQRNSMSSDSLNHSVRPMTFTRANLEDYFPAESSSPRFSDRTVAQSVYSPTHKSAVCSPFQQQQQNLLSPINTNFSPRNIDNPLLQASFGVPSSGKMSPRAMEPISPRNSRVSILAQRDRQQQFRSLSSRDLGSNVSAIVGSPTDTWLKWGTDMGKPDWAVNTEELGRLRQSSSFKLANNGKEPDLSWVQSLVKESPPEMMKDKCVRHVSEPELTGAGADLGEGSTSHSQIDQLSAWMETKNTN
ncbi:zinc finger CCCH domain-containing protein 24 [Solanum lycopersicum]|uniref:zinc finger CCCH domain-containing protein 24 n=1 Tax=Solanum lycopersicum TaxID=4081 RepID=UPI0002769339|nr:zinc finger CCCH domain-containing protein 24 [Solanum lycopersicum]